MGDQSNAGFIHTQDSTTQNDNDNHPSRKKDSNPRSQQPSD
jgi:hypothetical protein